MANKIKTKNKLGVPFVIKIISIKMLPAKIAVITYAISSNIFIFSPFGFFPKLNFQFQ